MAVAVFLAALWRASPLTHRSPANDDPPDTIRYFGHLAKLTRAYSTYEDYKDDPDNIDPPENAHVYDLVTHAPVDHSYPDRRAFIHATLALAFPGYGASFLGSHPAPDGSALELVGIEIPRSNKTRFLAFRNFSDVFTLLDDFVEDDAQQLTYVRPGPDGQLSYFTEKQQPALTRHPNTNIP